MVGPEELMEMEHGTGPLAVAEAAMGSSPARVGLGWLCSPSYVATSKELSSALLCTCSKEQSYCIISYRLKKKSP